MKVLRKNDMFREKGEGQIHRKSGKLEMKVSETEQSWVSLKSVPPGGQKPRGEQVPPQ